MSSDASPEANQNPRSLSLRQRAAARAQAVLKVAQIFSVKEARSFPTGDAAVVVQIGDPTCAPHLHGLRASREHWVEIFARLAEADPFIAERVRARLV